ncbi:uncharacterized protein LOC126657006 [Mercurialis annua]|uniref:uncharacterized protein LOC126657006 n=1 Tax=Mercurialis annua TaxID=3986 RepID=UPI00215F5C2C|nr:uncharacterized protein LOC126657006 [Mercurialis annua]
MEKCRRKEPRNTSFLNFGNPLSAEIRDEPFPLNYKTPQLDDYNGTGDPITHLSCFQVVMMYQSLKEGSIRSFDELARAFRTHFAPSIQRKKKSNDLKLFYQKPGESLQSYIDRFNAEAVEVGNLNDDTVIDAMKDNTAMMAFRDNLITNPVQTYSQLMDRAWNYRNLDEEQQRKATQTTTQFQAPRTTFNQPSSARQDRFRPRNQQQSVPLRTKPHRPVKVEDQAFIPLNTVRSHILMWIQNNNEPVRYPPKLQYEGDRKKYCQFYDGHGHVTDECGSLKKEIDRLVQVGRLKDFVAQSKNCNSGGSYRGEHSGKREEAPPPKRQNISGVINAIAGGMADPEYKRGRRKRQKVVMNISVASPLPEVSFGSADGEGINLPHQDPLVISGLIENFWVMRQLVDEGSSVNLITKQAYLGIGCSILNLKPVKTPLVGLGGAPIQAEGVAELTVELGKENGSPEGGLVGITKKFKTLFMVVDMPLAYNVILGRPMLYNIGAVTCIKYLCMKIPTEDGVVTVRGRQDITKQCYLVSMREVSAIETMEVPDSDEGKLEPHGKLERVKLTGITPRSVQIGAELPKPINQEITDMLIRNEVEFVNTPGEIEGVDPAIISHKLNVDPKHKPVKQKKRAFVIDRQIAIRSEVDKLLAAGFIRRVYYPEWLSNVVLIKSQTGNGDCA